MSEVFLLGVDGCRKGWLGVLGRFEPEKGRFAGEEVGVAPRLAELLALSAKVIAIDMPLGLPEEFTPKGRLCDQLARRLLGPRAATIFTPPPRQAFLFQDYRKLYQAGVKLSRQSFNLLGKIKELHSLLGSSEKLPVYETHPELVFWSLNRAPLPSKHRPEGLKKRLELLLKTGLFKDLPSRLDQVPATLKVDLLDAYACLLAAKRIFSGEAQVLPPRPPRDRRGFPMAIWF